jgi:hypothetical protein
MRRALRTALVLILAHPVLSNTVLRTLAQEPPKPPAPGGATAPKDAATKLDFEDVKVDELPKGFTVATTLGDPKLESKPAKWAVVEEKGAPSGKQVLKLVDTTNEGEVFNVLMRDEAAPVDLTVSVKLRADSGAADRGGGLVWRAKDASNYYIARWNPLEKNLRCYRVEAGKRIRLQSVDVATEGDAWHTLAVTMKGRVMEISFDGKALISCADPTFPDAGKVGLWTKADACTTFDDLEIAAAK